MKNLNQTLVLALLVATLYQPLQVSASSYSLFRGATVKTDSVEFIQGHFGDLKARTCSLETYTCTLSPTAEPPSGIVFPPLPSQTQIFQNEAKNRALVETKVLTAGAIEVSYHIGTLAKDTWKTTPVAALPFEIGDVLWDTQGNRAVFIAKKAMAGTFSAVLFDLTSSKKVSFTISESAILKTFSPDGTSLAYYLPAVTNKSNAKQVVLLQLQGDEMKESRFAYEVEKDWELNLDANRLMHFSPSGKKFAFIEDSTGFQHVRLLQDTKLAITDAKPATWSDLNTAAEVFFVSDEILLIVANSKANPYDWSLYEYNTISGIQKKVASNVSIMFPLQGTKDNGVFFGQMEGPNMRPVVYSPKDGSLQGFKGLVTVKDTYQHTEEVLTFKDGTSGVLVMKDTAKAAKSVPLIVWLHGGPYRQTNTGFHSYPGYATYDWALQEFIEAGARVLKLDYPGSYGYGNEFTYSLLGANGEIEPTSIMAAIHEVQKDKGWNGDVYIMGNSYGGYLAPKLLTMYPKEIKGAIAINGVYEWRTLLKYLQTSIFNIHFGGVYDTKINKTNYDTASITNGLKNLTKKDEILIITGTEDRTINPDQAYTFYELLEKKHKNVEHVLIEGEDHVLTKKDSNVLMCKEVFQFINLKKFKHACTLG